MSKDNVVDLSDFRGISRSFTTLHGTAGWPECPACGSSLAGRGETVRSRGIVEVEVFRCRCGRGRHVSREVAAA